jgi:hypothetical protein
MADQDPFGQFIAKLDPFAQFAAPAVSHAPTPQPAEGGELGRLYDDFMKANNAQPTESGRRMFIQMGEGAMGGGLSSGAPINVAIKKGLPVLQGLAQRLYGGLLKTSKAVKQEFGDVVPGLLEKRRLITKGGAEAAETAIDQSVKKADDMIANTPRPSQGVSPRRIVSEFRPVRDAVQARVDAGVAPASELDKVVDRARRIGGSAKKTGGRFDPTRAQTLKRTSQDAAEGGYRQMERGNAKMLSTDDLLDAATARGFKGGLEDIIPGIGKQNQTTQALIGESRAMADAVGRSSNHLPFGSVSDLAAMGAGAATNPAVGIVSKLSTMAGPGSALAIGLNEASKLGLDDAMQRALLVAMSQGSHRQ